MTVPATRYEILLPLRYNDGTEIEAEKLLLTKQELVQNFGALTVNPQPVEGVWTYQGAEYQDLLFKYIVDVEQDTTQTQEFFQKFKDVLKVRFKQFDIWIVAYPIRVI